jgi:membrane associated rhomboid family serine protease
VVGFSLAFIAINLATEFINFVPGNAAGSVAWQTHLFGYGCGLFLIKPWVLAFHRPSITQI